MNNTTINETVSTTSPEATDIVQTLVYHFSKEFGWILIILFFDQLCNFHLMAKVMKARKEFNIEYPNLYASRTIDGDVKAN